MATSRGSGRLVNVVGKGRNHKRQLIWLYVLLLGLSSLLVLGFLKALDLGRQGGSGILVALREKGERRSPERVALGWGRRRCRIGRKNN